MSSTPPYRCVDRAGSIYGLTGEIILYRNDAKPRQQSARGSRFKVAFRKPPKDR